MTSTFASASLVRLLSPWTPVPAPAGGADFAERLAGWVGAFDAITLQSAHQAVRTLGSGAATGAPPAGRVREWAAALERTRAAIAASVARAAADAAEFAAVEPTYAPFRQRQLELQRQMEQMVGALRDHVRHGLGRASRGLRQLAALDTALEQLLQRQQQLLLPVAADLLARRFEQLRAAHRQVVETTGQPDDPKRWREPGGWLRTFLDDWRQALLAELELRLEPVAGLLEAAGHEPIETT
ncbi:MAG TPA: DUF3348 family protein [Ramlibacter sp.]|nr:DUF3348 family protein [Ramlibacter sp.]